MECCALAMITWMRIVWVSICICDNVFDGFAINVHGYTVDACWCVSVRALVHLWVAAQVAVQYHGVRAATKLFDKSAKDLGRGRIFQRDRHAVDLSVGVHDDVQVDGRVVVRRQRLRCFGNARRVLNFRQADATVHALVADGSDHGNESFVQRPNDSQVRHL